MAKDEKQQNGFYDIGLKEKSCKKYDISEATSKKGDGNGLFR